MKRKSLIIISIAVLFLLLIPFIAMQFTDEVDWSLFDFLIAAILLFITGLTIEFIIRKVKGNIYRIILIVAILAMLILLWAELGVGILGTPFSGN